MFRCAVIFLFALLAGPHAGAQDPAPVVKKADGAKAVRQARSLAHELAAAGSYGQRAALWECQLDGDAVAVVPVQLYAGNTYQLAVGFDEPSAVIGLSVFDSRGKLVPGGVQRGQGRMVFQVKPTRSGVFSVRLRLADDAVSNAAAALTYVYK